MSQFRCLHAVLWFLLPSTMAIGEVSVVSFDTQNLSQTVLTNTYSKTVQAGDVVVFSMAGNRRHSSLAPVIFSSSAGAMTVVDSSATDPFPTSYTAYKAMTSNGTYSFTMSVNTGMTAKTGLHILRASSGNIQEPASAVFANTNGNSLSSQSLVYDWGNITKTGVIIEAVSSRTATTTPLNVSIDASGNNFRLICSTQLMGNAFTSTYTFAGGTAGQLTSSGVGLFFAEGTNSISPQPTNRVSPYAGTNVLLIMMDDYKPISGAYGDTLVQTPEIDRLSAMGTTFLNAQCQWAVCGPSRACITTGLMPEETGVLGFKMIRGDAVDPAASNTVVRLNIVTLPQYFRYNGFRTAAVGKIHDPRTVGSLDTNTLKVAEDGRQVDDPPSWGEPVDPLNLPTNFFFKSAYVDAASGFDPAGKPTTYSTNLPDSAFEDGIICNEGIALLNSLATNDTQFFLGVGFKKPHLPFVAPQQYWDLYNRTNFVIHPFQQHPLHEVIYSWNYANELAEYDDIPVATNIPPAKQQELLHGYYACISFVDSLVGRLLDELETLGLASNTIVVLWGDHGFHLGDHAEWGKHTNLEQASRVPFIIYNPFGGVSNQLVKTPVSSTDLYPTLCAMAGLAIPQQPLNQRESPTTPASGRSLKGKNLTAIVNGDTNAVRTGAITLFRRGATGYSYRTDRYRYIEWIQSGNVIARELYDYVDDPMETINLAGEPDYDALMYQYSVAMRTEMNAYKTSSSDTACPILQGTSPFNTITGAPVIPIERLKNGEINWQSATGVIYRLMSSTNLESDVWTARLTNVVSSPLNLPTEQELNFFRLDVVAP